MNFKNASIISAIAIMIITIVALVFFREFAKEAAPVPPPAIPEAVREPQSPGYAIPVNTIPSAAAIEENIKKAKAERAEADRMAVKVRAEAAAKREEIRAELEVQAAASKSAVGIPQKAAAQPARRVVTPSPTREERAQMQTRGVVAY